MNRISTPDKPKYYPNQHDSCAFGFETPRRSFNSNSNRYGFNGKEKEKESETSQGDYDFGARIYDSKIARFLSVDPDAPKYPFMTPYCFAANNPIRLVDIDGKGPGDSFGSIDAAAIDWAKTYNDNSIANKREYGSTIIEKTDEKGVKTYSYTVPNVGKNGESVVPSERKLEENEKKAAAVHSHGNFDGAFYKEGDDRNNEFSVDDEGYCGYRLKPFPFYLSTPSGELKVYRPGKDAPGESTPVPNSSGIPSDPNSKTKVKESNSNYTTLPKNEPAVWPKGQQPANVPNTAPTPAPESNKKPTG